MADTDEIREQIKPWQSYEKYVPLLLCDILDEIRALRAIKEQLFAPDVKEEA